MTAIDERPQTTAPTETPDADLEKLLSGEGVVTLPSGRVITTAERRELFAALAADFAPDEIEKLPRNAGPKPRQGEWPQKYNCKKDHRDANRASSDQVYCGGYHPYSFHLDYVGHAGVTMRLNEVVGTEDWGWEFMHLDVPEWAQRMAAELIRAGEFDRAERIVREHGQPIQRDGGLWIRMTVLGITRIGFGDAQGKTGPNAIKELIGDAIRNAGLRFGIATYLWNKSEAVAERKAQAADAAYDAMIVEQTTAWESSKNAREEAALARARQDNAAQASQTRQHPNSRQPEERQGQTRLAADQPVAGQVEKTEDEWYAEFQAAKAGGPDRLRSWGNMIRQATPPAPGIVLNAVRQTLAQMEAAAPPAHEQGEDLPPIDPQDFPAEQ